MKRAVSPLRSGSLAAIIFGSVLTVTNAVGGVVRIPSGSMEPTIQVGDYIVVNRLAYGLHVPFSATLEVARWDAPKRGDIVIFNAPRRASASESLFIKRTVALAGDVVEVRDHLLTVNGEPADYLLAAPGTLREGFGAGPTHEIHVGPANTSDFGPYQVPEGHIFVMGDHRDDSADSRIWGPLELNRVRGKAVARAAHVGLPPGGPSALN
ncbi:Signal peptidase I [compost metagenome]